MDRLVTEKLKREAERIEALTAEQEKIETDHQDADELPDEVDRRLGEIEHALLALEQRREVYEPSGRASAGAFISLDSEGRLRVERGYIRPEDEMVEAGSNLGSVGADAEPSAVVGGAASVPATAITLGGPKTESARKVLRMARGRCRIGSSAS